MVYCYSYLKGNEARKKKEITIREMLKLFRIWVLTTQFKFRFRESLWLTTDI